MKKILLFFSLFITFSSFAQSWKTIIYETGDPLSTNKKMIKTVDDGFVLLRPYGDTSAGFTRSQHRLLKYDGNGDLVWEKGYSFGATSAGSTGWSEWGGGRAVKFYTV